MKPHDGLTDADVALRVEMGQTNDLDPSPSRSLWDIIRGNLFTLFNAMLGTALLIVVLVGSLRDAVFGFVVVINLLIGTFTEYRAKRTLDRLEILNRAPVTVKRAGAKRKVKSTELVIDDVVAISSGEQLPADGEVIESIGLEIDESLLTGESTPIYKRDSDRLLSGSSVIAGEGLYRITQLGADSYAHQVTAQARRFSLVGSELRDAINKILVAISWIIVPVALLLFWSQIHSVGGFRYAFDNGVWREALVQAVAGIVGMVPEGLVLLTSMNFALAAIILARHWVLVQELPAVEVLARVDTICLDKTGTLTDGSMEMVDILRAEDLGATGPAGVDPRSVLHSLATAPDANATAKAMAPPLEGIPKASLEVVTPFSSQRKWSAHTDGTFRWFFGAPDVLFSSGEDAKIVERALTRHLSAGARVLALGYVQEEQAWGHRDPVDSGLPPGLRLASLVLLRERLRPDAAQAIDFFTSQGLEVKVISGDNPSTVESIAHAVGMDDIQAVDARELTTTQALHRAAVNNNVFGRVHPEQKRSLVHALQATGRTVAMTGDGVNDALALKDADLGIAMGSGAPATKSVAQLVLLNNRFEALPRVVNQGRRVMANMERVASLFLTKTTYAIFLALIVVLLAWPYPFLPRHLTVVGTFTIGTPAFFLALSPTIQRYRPGFLRRVLRLAVPCGLVAGSGVVVVYAILHNSGQAHQAPTGATLVLIIMALWLLGILARPWTLWRGGLVIVMGIFSALMVAIGPVRDFIALQIPTALTWALVVSVGAVGAAAIEGAYRMRGWWTDKPLLGWAKSHR